MLRVVEESFNKISDELDEVEADIQERIVDNFKRRKNLKLKLQEAAQQQQNILARLMQRVVGDGAKSSLVFAFAQEGARALCDMEKVVFLVIFGPNKMTETI